MADTMDDIARQARQGSVAAIIQMLNEKLADSGVRTRAIFASGVLQLLCEAANVDQLEQSTLVAEIRQILEAIAPRNIRRVNINSRIVREQQLLWLEEISRNPESQLLWSEEITLKKPNIFRRLAEDIKAGKPTQRHAENFPKPTPMFAREKRQFWRGIVGGASLSLLLLLVGWVFYEWLSPKLSGQMSAQNPQSPTPSSPEPATSQSPVAAIPQTVPTQSPVAAIPQTAPSQSPVAAIPQTAPSQSPVAAIVTAQTADPFVEAVRLAEQTSAAGKAAKSSAAWLEIAAKWQKASDLMAAVPAVHSRYKLAQDRVVSYRQNRESALREAKKVR
jgi:hypothetical protein